MSKFMIASHRELKRVPMDFDWKLDEIWPGYLIRNSLCNIFKGEDQCNQCKKFCNIVNLKSESFCDDYKEIDPPSGEGYQMWETTSEGSPQTPIFKILDELLRYCARNCTIFGEKSGTIEDWRNILIDRECTEF